MISDRVVTCKFRKFKSSKKSVKVFLDLTTDTKSRKKTLKSDVFDHFEQFTSDWGHQNSKNVDCWQN